jgi:hypothetical protein
MNIFLLLNLIGMLVWLLPPLRQYGTRFFIFFLVIGFADIAGSLYGKYIDPGSNLVVYILVAAVAYTSIQRKEHIKKFFFYYAAAALIAVGIFLRFPAVLTGSVLILIFNFLIIITLFKDLLNEFFNLKTLNVFLALLLFYEFTTVTKLATLITGNQNNYFYFSTTTAIQILLGLFFSIFRYDYKKLILQFR